MKNKNNNSPWSLKINTASLVLIPAAVGINYIGKLFAGMLKLPLWLDSIGTCLAAALAGPANLSILKNNKAKAIRFTTLEAICRELDCQPGDIIEYKKE